MRALWPFLALVACVSGHGRLMEPPARNSMWRFGFPNPINYNDNEVFCGGFGVQFNKNDGKCGVCGDNWADPTPREHENGGKYGKDVIARRYVMGQDIEIEVDLTTNHFGYFEMKLCPETEVSQECMDRHPLYLVTDPASYRYYIPKDTGKKDYVYYKVRLPQDVTCQQCAIQWTYFTGNTWGKCENGTEAVGCGDQETFRNCADVQIYSLTSGVPPTAISIPNAIYFRDVTAPGGRRALVVRYQMCQATKLYRYLPGMDDWCHEHCLRYPSVCPKAKCVCPDECVGIGEYRDIEGTDVWCQRQCLRYPSTCPKDVCSCFPSNEDNVVDALRRKY